MVNNMLKLINDDCLEAMKHIETGSIDLILTDPPYGTTACKWDSIIPFEPMWEQLKRIIKSNGAIVLFGDGLFSATLKLSNSKMWRYDLVWNKVLSSGFLNANRMQLRQHEMIHVFYKKLPTYNPQKSKGIPNHCKGKSKKNTNHNYGKFKVVETELGDMKHPTSILTFSKPHPSKTLHPTQKPVELLEYLIKTYTNKNDTVLDFTMGSGSTGIACVNTDRKFIGIEKDEEYFKIAKNRIETHVKPKKNRELEW